MVGPKTRRGLGRILTLLVAAHLLACAGEPRSTLSDLSDVGDLKDRFNRDTGKPRVVLLLSPT